MAANPYSLETYIDVYSNRISSDTINYYVSYMKDKGYSINAENIFLVERILYEAYPLGTTFQAWYTFDKGTPKDDNIKQSLVYAFERIGIQCMSIREKETDNNNEKASQ